MTCATAAKYPIRLTAGYRDRGLCT